MGKSIGSNSNIVEGTGGATVGELKGLGYDPKAIAELPQSASIGNQVLGAAESLDLKQAGQRYDAQRQAIQNRGGAPQFNITQPQLDMSLFAPYADPTKQRKSFWG